MSAWHRSIPVGLSLCAAGLLNLLALPAGAGVAVSGATLHTLTEAGTMEQGVILIDEGRIQAVGGPNLPVPAGYSVVEAGGRVVTPGLIESFCRSPSSRWWKSPVRKPPWTPWWPNILPARAFTSVMR
jgi:cytosine/adenosine deaminase-related metal-dependent hydrolase